MSTMKHIKRTKIVNQYKVNTEFKIKVDTKLKCFGTPEDFTVSYFSDSENVLIDTDIEFVEIVKESEEVEAKIIEDVLAGSKSIKVEEGHKFKLYDLLEIKEKYYIIVKIDNNILYLDKELEDSLVVNDLIEFSNLTGIYEAPISFDEVGIYTIVVKNMKNLRTLISSVDIVSETVEDKLSSDKTFI